MALAFEWVARIFAVSLLMFLPGVGGHWLDGQLGTNFLALVGFVFGFCTALASLLVMVNQKPSQTTSESVDTSATKFDHDDGGSGEQ